MAEQGRRSATPVHDGVCFHCQQYSEKYLKALLAELGIPVPRTHNLEIVLSLLQPHHRVLQPLRRGLKFLTRFGVETRYPGEDATKRHAEAAWRWAERVRTTARALLGLHERRREK